jgi:hypothetical protein
MNVIITSEGYETFVSDEDYEYLKVFCWCTNGRAVIRRVALNKTSLMHREIALRMGLNFSLIDHKDRDWKNNVRTNIRGATPLQNTQNRGPDKSSLYSSYKGVSFCQAQKKWVARIRHLKQRITIGRYLSEDDAARAYNHYAMSLFGEFAYLNTIEP